MAKETVEALIEGGKATAAPPLGPALGPLKVNIGQVVSAINEKTKSFKGMQVPVKVIVDSDTKEFEITVGTPPAAALVKKEAGVEKGSGNPLADKVADLKIEQIIKIAKMKEDALIGKNLKSKVREIVGTCQSMGVLVEGVPAPDALKAIKEGLYDEQIRTEKTELTEDELKELAAEKEKLQAELEKRRKALETKAKELITENKNKEPSKIKAALVEAKIPLSIIEKTMTDAGIVVVSEKKEGAPVAAKK